MSLERTWKALPPRHVSRATMLKFVTDLLEELQGSGCTFWACEGPDAPARMMVTCSTCYTIKDARRMFEWLQGPDPGPRKRKR